MLVEASNDLIWTFDLRTMTFSYCSQSIERLLGYAPEEAIGARLDDIFFPEGKKHVSAVFGSVITGKSDTDRVFIAVEHRRKDNGVVWLALPREYGLDKFAHLGIVFCQQQGFRARLLIPLGGKEPFCCRQYGLVALLAFPLPAPGGFGQALLVGFFFSGRHM